MNKIFIERIEEQYLEYDENHLICYKGKPFTGIGYYPFDDGLGLAYEVHYQDGHEHGLKRKWHSRGQLEYEIPMLRGMGHGIITMWHPNGQKKEVIHAEYGITWHRITWDEQGNIIDEFKLEKGSTNYSLLLEFRELYKDLKP